MNPDKYQQAIIDAYQKTNQNIFVEATAGCLGRDVPVLMFDGSIKMSQDITVGDVLMGPDSTPRNVLSTKTGRSNMYRIVPVKGMEWTCNDSHIMVVHDQYITRSMRLYNTHHKTDIVDRNISDILRFRRNDNSVGHLKLVRTGVEFPEVHTGVDPYLLGLWLAEGTKGQNAPTFTIYKEDTDILDYLRSYSLPTGVSIKEKPDGESCIRVKFLGAVHEFNREFKENCVDDTGMVSIPKNYLINSRKNRLRLLAGLLDGDGYLSKNGFSISTKFEQLGKDIVYLCQSLGFQCKGRWKKSTILSRNFEGYYYRISIYGHTDQIPNVLKRKHAKERKQVKDVLHVGFSVHDIGVGDWYGFTVDGDNRYLLGDFTITHNSGKTTTLIELSRRTPPTRDSIFLAFNKSIANELANRLPPDRKAQTLHSCALSALRRAYKIDIDIADSKYFYMALEDLKWPEKQPVKQRMSVCSKVARLYDLMRVNCIYGGEKEVFSLGLRYGEEVSDEIVDRAIKLHAIATQVADRFFFSNTGGKLKMDFTDMLTYAIRYVPSSEFKRYSVVMTDEIQDLNPLQYQLIQRLKNPGGRLIAVGDERQCQPAGTKILMDDGSEKNIEDIQIGETVVTYSSSRGTFLHHRTYSRGGNIVHRGCKVLAKEERYTDKTIRIRTSSGKESEYSFEHICYAKLDYKGFGEVFCTYLMEDAKGRFRVGKTNIKQRGKQSGFGLKMRMRHEGCVKAWILDTFDTDRDAYLMEQIVSYKFGIPQICFSGDEEEIDLIYSCIPDIKNRAIQCLTEFHRLIDYPFVKLNDDNHYSRLHSFTINACNLLPKIMQVNVFYENNRKPRTHGKNGDINYTLIGSCYETIEEVRLLQERKKVYSLEIEKEHNYVADKILTHNCIYSFQGSNLDTLNAIRNAPNTVSLPLSMTYRCARAIVNKALEVFPDGIEAAPFAKEGEVREGDVYEAQEGDFILCRNNAPLVDAFIGLLKQNKRAQILGKEFGQEVIDLIDSVNEIWDLEKKLQDFENRLRGKGIANPMKVPAYSELDDRVNVLISLYLHFGSLDRVRQVVGEMFTNKPDYGKQVTLSTIHKSKGLEANRVFFLNSGLIPSKYATSELELYAEDCLKFVAITRAKNSLIYCHI